MCGIYRPKRDDCVRASLFPTHKVTGVKSFVHLYDVQEQISVYMYLGTSVRNNRENVLLSDSWLFL